MSITYTIDGYAPDVVAISGDSSSTFTLATIPCATITSGMANNARRGIVVACDLINDTDDNYSAMVQLTSHIKLTAGPTYTLETIQYSIANYGASTGSDGSNLFTGLTMDINSGNLRVRALIKGESIHIYTTISIRGL